MYIYLCLITLTVPRATTPVKFNVQISLRFKSVPHKTNDRVLRHWTRSVQKKKNLKSNCCFIWTLPNIFILIQKVPRSRNVDTLFMLFTYLYYCRYVVNMCAGVNEISWRERYWSTYVCLSKQQKYPCNGSAWLHRWIHNTYIRLLCDL